MLPIIATVACWPDAAAADWVFDLDAGTIYDSNLSRGYEPAGILSDSALTVALSAGQFIAIDDRNSLTLTANLRAASFQRYHGLGSGALGATVAYRRKFGLGMYAPSIRVAATAARESYRQSVRDGQSSELSVSLNKRLSDRLELSGGGFLERFNSRNASVVSPERSGNAFDIKGRNLFARAEYALSDRWLGYAGLNLRRGGMTASAKADDEIFDISSAVTRDPAFGPDYLAYRLSGETHAGSAGVSVEINRRGSLNFGLTREITKATGGLNYRRTLANATFLFNF